MKHHKHKRTYNYIHGVIQRKVQYFWMWEYRSLWEKLRTNVYLILNGYRDRIIWISSSNSLGLFCGFEWRIKFKKKGGYTWLIARSHLEAATRNKEEHKNQIRWKTRDFHSRVAYCTEIDDGIFEYLLHIL
jgi:hypothetical protein